MNQKYVKYMTCRLQIMYLRELIKNYCSSQTVHQDNLRLNTITMATITSAIVKCLKKYIT